MSVAGGCFIVAFYDLINQSIMFSLSKRMIS